MSVSVIKKQGLGCGGEKDNKIVCFIFPQAYFNKYNEFIDKMLYKKTVKNFKIKDASVGKKGIMNMQIITRK